MRCRKTTLAMCLTSILVGSATYAAEPPPIEPERFKSLHELIRPQAGESRWRDISWLTSTWDARKKAAAEGKPIYIIYGGGAAPIGGC